MRGRLASSSPSDEGKGRGGGPRSLHRQPGHPETGAAKPCLAGGPGWTLAARTVAEPNAAAVDALIALSSTLLAAAAAARQRRALVLAGDAAWCRAAARTALDGAGLDSALWLAEPAPAGAAALPPGQARQLLGRELGGLVIDAHAGFDPDAFGAAGGALRGGGLLLLLTPPLDAWSRHPDPEHRRLAVAPWRPEQISGRFLGRLARVIRAAPGVALVEQGRPPPAPPPVPAPAPRPRCGGDWATEDQRRAVEAVLRVAAGHRRRPLVLVSDRGRGKSAALGIAAARLLAGGAARVLVTAPRPEAAAVVFEQARRRGAGAELVFLPPDALAAESAPAALVLVDEAAAIPAPLLERLLARHARIVFATTVHGYEGSGRGFAVRFREVLDKRTPGWRALRLEQPVRWAAGDPVEALAFRALLLDAAPAADRAVALAGPEACAVERLERNRLAGDEATLSELFGLLVLAHYRTSPLDLRHLLDGPNLAVWVLRHGGAVAATALVATEGGFDPATARAVWAGRRRLRGHLLAQSLTVHAGLEQAACLRGARVVRIAVHPAARDRGLGRRLLAAVGEQARSAGLDYLGSSFGAEPGLLRFWERCGLLPVRVGIKREASSGERSVMVLQPLSSAGEALFEAARRRLARHLPCLLADPLRDLDPDLAAALLRRRRPRAADLDTGERAELAGFAAGERAFETCLPALGALAGAALTDAATAAGLEAEERNALILRVLQRRSWGETAAALGLPGRAAVMERLRQGVGRLLAGRCQTERGTSV